MKPHTKLLFAGLPFFLLSGVAYDMSMGGASFGLAVIGLIFEISAIVKYCDTPSTPQ